MPAGDTPDWTRGPAKWAAVGVLGGASIVGTLWATLGRGAAQSSLAPTTSLRPGPSAPPHGALSPPSPDALPPDATDVPAPARKINLNTAPLAELDLLPGVGVATAQAIVDYRTRHGPFRTVSDLDKVPGIGPSKLNRLRDLVTVD